jgi:hypothetical protein
MECKNMTEQEVEEMGVIELFRRVMLNEKIDGTPKKEVEGI